MHADAWSYASPPHIQSHACEGRIRRDIAVIVPEPVPIHPSFTLPPTAICPTTQRTSEYPFSFRPLVPLTLAAHCTRSPVLCAACPPFHHLRSARLQPTMANFVEVQPVQQGRQQMGVHSSADYFHSKAWASRARGDYTAAIHGYSRAIAMDPRHFKSVFNRACCHARLGRFRAAAQDLATARALEPSNPHVFFNLAMVSDALGQPRRACRAISSALGIDPGNRSYLQSRARLYRKAGDFERASADYMRLQVIAAMDAGEEVAVEDAVFASEAAGDVIGDVVGGRGIGRGGDSSRRDGGVGHRGAVGPPQDSGHGTGRRGRPHTHGKEWHTASGNPVATVASSSSSPTGGAGRPGPGGSGGGKQTRPEEPRAARNSLMDATVEYSDELLFKQDMLPSHVAYRNQLRALVSKPPHARTDADLQALVAYIKRLRYFRGVDDVVKKELCRTMIGIRGRRGDVVYNDGGDGNLFFIIVEGKVTLHTPKVADGGGNSMSDGMMSPGKRLNTVVERGLPAAAEGAGIQTLEGRCHAHYQHTMSSDGQTDSPLAPSLVETPVESPIVSTSTCSAIGASASKWFNNSSSIGTTAPAGTADAARPGARVDDGSRANSIADRVAGRVADIAADESEVWGDVYKELHRGDGFGELALDAPVVRRYYSVVNDDSTFVAVHREAYCAALDAAASKQLDDVIRFMGCLSLFQNFPSHELEMLARVVKPMRFGCDEVVVSQGSVPEGLYMVRRGKCWIVKDAGVRDRLVDDFAAQSSPRSPMASPASPIALGIPGIRTPTGRDSADADSEENDPRNTVAFREAVKNT